MKTAVRRESYRGFESLTLRDGFDDPGLWVPRAGLVGMVTALLGAMLLLPPGDRGVAIVPLVVACGVVVRSLASRVAIWVVQFGLVATVAFTLLADGRSVVSSGLILGQVVGLLLLADRFTARLLHSRTLERTAHLQARQRADLLDAVRDLPDSDVQAGAVAAVATLRAAGFAAAAVRLHEDGQLVDRHRDGFDPSSASVVDEHRSDLAAIHEDRTQVLGPDARPTGLRSGDQPVSSLVTVPIPGVTGPTGVLIAAHVGGSPVDRHERELVEVLAQYLGTVVATRAALDRQRFLLERGGRLEDMGEGLLEAVSEEIRDPLTVLRLATQVLGHHGPVLAEELRAATLGRLEHAAAELREVLDSLLDFSRLHADVAEPEVVAGRLDGVLEVAQLPWSTSEGGDAASTVTVVVDPALAGHGLALLQQAGRGRGGITAEPRLRASAEGHELGLLLRGAGLATGSQVQIELGTRLLTAAGARFEPSAATASATVWFPTRMRAGDQDVPPRPSASRPGGAEARLVLEGPPPITSAADLLDDRVARVSLLVVVAFAIADITIGGHLLGEPATAVVLALSVAVVALTTLRQLIPRWVPESQVELLRGSLSGFGGPILVASGLLVTRDLEVLQLGPLFALILLVNGFVGPDRLRVPVLLWAGVVWLLVDALAGTRSGPILAVVTVGVVTLVFTIGRSSALLSSRLRGAAAARRRAEQRAELLAALLRTRDVDRDQVLAGVADGLGGLGVRNVRVREVDGAAEVGTDPAGNDPIDTVPVDTDPAGEAAPGFVRYLRDEGQIIAVVEADATTEEMDALESEAIDLVLAYAARALARARRYRTDRAAAAELQELDRRISGLLSTVSHELRTPLTVVQGLTATLIARWGDLDDVRRHELLGRIDANAERLGQMMARLLESSYLHGGGFELRQVRLPARNLLADAVERLEELLVDRHVSVDADAQLRVRVDPLLLAHVLDNLIVNATVHTPAGCRIWLRARASGGSRVEVEVADDGPGIDPRDRELVLERFYRGGDDTHRAVTRGLGLGLSVAADVVDAHGGRLRAGSAAEGGASFTFDVAAG